MYMPAGEELPAITASRAETDYGEFDDDVSDELDAAPVESAVVHADHEAPTNEWIVMRALERVAPWTTSVSSDEKTEPVLIVDEELVPDTLVTLPAATRAAAS